jgi:hypothetical protein
VRGDVNGLGRVMVRPETALHTTKECVGIPGPNAFGDILLLEADEFDGGDIS